ncbi:MAG: Acetyltransferase [Deltaproteobacteria bacterium]|jgi:ribosomal-protein-alanine N-acetyltransferase|nr:Acetyltransferase [Deltaproteobacteria bacterium]
MDITIRPVQSRDLLQLLRVEAQAAPKSQLAAWELFLLSIRYPENFLVAEGEEIVGYVVFTPKGHLVSLVVARRHRRQGIGTRLVEEVIRRSPGIPLRLEVRVGNHGARRFYERLGFGQVEKMESYYADGEDGLLLERAVPEGETREE